MRDFRDATAMPRTDLFAPALAQAGLKPDPVIYFEAGRTGGDPSLGRLLATN